MLQLEIERVFDIDGRGGRSRIGGGLTGTAFGLTLDRSGKLGQVLTRPVQRETRGGRSGQHSDGDTGSHEKTHNTLHNTRSRRRDLEASYTEVFDSG